jgi:hypothetical protein
LGRGGGKTKLARRGDVSRLVQRLTKLASIMIVTIVIVSAALALVTQLGVIVI